MLVLVSKNKIITAYGEELYADMYPFCGMKSANILDIFILFYNLLNI